MVVNTARARWVISDDCREALGKSDLFRDLNTNQLMEIAALVEEIELAPDDVMLDEGGSAKDVFVVISGRAVAQLAMYHGWLSLGLVGPGDVAGWTAITDAQTYPASVKALTEMRVARIDAEGLMLVMNLDPTIGYPVNKRLAAVFCQQYQAALAAFKTNS